MRSRWTAALVCAGAIWGITTSARAEDMDGGASRRAAGWAVLGIGGSLGLGSVTSGAVLLAMDSYNTREIAAATLAGGGVTLLVSLIVGIPLVVTSDKSEKREEYVVDALSGRVRF